jgi:hypothetical protein
LTEFGFVSLFLQIVFLFIIVMIRFFCLFVVAGVEVSVILGSDSNESRAFNATNLLQTHLAVIVVNHLIKFVIRRF